MLESLVRRFRQRQGGHAVCRDGLNAAEESRFPRFVECFAALAAVRSGAAVIRTDCIVTRAQTLPPKPSGRSGGPCTGSCRTGRRRWIPARSGRCCAGSVATSPARRFTISRKEGVRPCIGCPTTRLGHGREQVALNHGGHGKCHGNFRMSETMQIAPSNRCTDRLQWQQLDRLAQAMQEVSGRPSFWARGT